MVFVSLLDLSGDIFKTLFLILAAALSSSFLHGFQTQRSAATFVLLLCLLTCGTQLYFLIQAAITIPGRIITYHSEYSLYLKLCNSFGSMT